MLNRDDGDVGAHDIDSFLGLVGTKAHVFVTVPILQ